LTRILFFFKAISLNKKIRFGLIHDYSSLPILIFYTGFLGKICQCKSIHTLSTVSENFLSSAKLAFGFKWIDKVICTSERIKEELIKLKGNLSKIVYIPFGVDTSIFKPSPKNKLLMKKIGLGQNQKVILFLGSLEKRKGAFILAESVKRVLKKCPNTIFVFASYGKEGRDRYYSSNKKELMKILNRFRNNVRLLEGKHNVAELMSIADIFVLPAVSGHGTLAQPLTLLEAMSAGKACLVSDIQKKDGLTKNRKNCLLFKSENTEDLAKKIVLLLLNQRLSKTISKSARKEIVSKFKIQTLANRISTVYNSLIF